MPYQGDSHPGPSKFTTDVSYLRKLPGLLILVQLLCSLLGFSLALDGAMRWYVRAGHGFYTVIAFLSTLSCFCWLFVRVLRLDALVHKTIDWNKVGLIHNGLNAFLLMVGSCVMIDVASGARTLRAAGVFGFLGFSAFLAGLIWEAIIWRSSRDSDIGFSTATVIQGRNRSRTPDSQASAGVAESASGEQEGVSFVGIKPRPVSAFLYQEPGGSGDVSSPMLVVPQSDNKDNNSASSGSSASSIQGEWQMASSNAP